MRSVVGSSNLRVAGRVFRGGEANASNYWRCGRGAIARFQSGASGEFFSVWFLGTCFLLGRVHLLVPFRREKKTRTCSLANT
jgi:hypothetical protein